MKTQLENQIRDSLRDRWPDIKINVYKIEEHWIALDAVSESFAPPYYEHLDEILKELDDKQPSWYRENAVSICPVTPDIFEGRVKEEGDL